MRRLLNTLFVLTEDSYLSLDGENVVLNREKAEMARFPLHTLENILCFSYPGASPALMGACVRRGIGLAFFTPAAGFWPGQAGRCRGTSSCGSSSTGRRTTRMLAACMLRGLSLGKYIMGAGCWSGPPATIPSGYRSKG